MRDEMYQSGSVTSCVSACVRACACVHVYMRVNKYFFLEQVNSRET